MTTHWNSRSRKPSRHVSPGLRCRRLGVERVEDRRLLAAVGFQTGMEAQLEAFQANAAGSFVAPMIITPSGSIAGNGTKAQLAGQTTIGPGIGVLPQGPSAFAFDATSDVIQSSGGSQVFLPIHVVDLPSPPVLPAPLPNPFPSPIDIGQVRRR